MKHTICKTLYLSLFLVPMALVSLPARAQQLELENHPGYVNLDVIPQTVDIEPSIEVHIKGAILRLAAAATEREDPELSDMLRGLRAIRVFGYNSTYWTEGTPATLEELAARMSDQLDNTGWDVMVRVREPGERVHVYLKEVDARLEGMMVMVVDSEEAVFVNITGTFDPEQIGRIGNKFDIDALEDLDIEY